MRSWWVVVAIASACGSPSPSSAPASSPTPPPPAVTKPAPLPEPEPDVPDMTATKALADAACPRVLAPFYFRVEKAGKVSYMLGTRHMSVGLDKMPATVKQQLAKASLVVFETPPGDDAEDDPPAGGKSLAEELGPALWAKYERLVGAPTASEMEHAGAAAATVALMMVYENQGALLDVEIEQFAAEQKIATGGLETSAFQSKLLVELLDLRMLRATLRGTPDRTTLRREAVEDLAEYCAGTDLVPGMDERNKKILIAGGYTEAELAAIDDKLLDQRNRAWMPKLEQMFARGDVFVVVGSDHLIGTRGVIAMLGQRGFSTTRLK